MANIATAAAIAIGLPMWIRAVVGPPAPPADLDFRHVDILLYIADGGSPRRRFATRRAGAASAPPRIDRHDTPDAESSGAAHDGRGRPDLVRVLSARRAQEYRSGCLSVTSDDAARYVHAPCRSRGVRMPGHAHGLRRVGTRQPRLCGFPRRGGEMPAGRARRHHAAEPHCLSGRLLRGAARRA